MFYEVYKDAPINIQGVTCIMSYHIILILNLTLTWIFNNTVVKKKKKIQNQLSCHFNLARLEFQTL